LIIDKGVHGHGKENQAIRNNVINRSSFGSLQWRTGADQYPRCIESADEASASAEQHFRSIFPFVRRSTRGLLHGRKP
jgi:hypothetical protein